MSATGRPTSPRSTGWSRRTVGSGSRPSCWTTRGWSPRVDQYTWISKYIFPGGALPSMRAIDDCVREHTNLRITERFHFGDHYARTLHCWRERFDAHAGEVDAIGFDALVPAHVGLLPRVLRGRASPPATSTSRSSFSNRGTDMATQPIRRRDPRRHRHRRARSTSCPCGCARGTAARPDRPAPRAWCSARRRALRRMLWSPGELGLARGLRHRRPRRRGRPRGRLPSRVGGRARARRRR